MKPKFRRAVFIVVYAHTEKGIQYLILKRKLHWNGWEFPKGGMRNFETKEKAVRREIKEETELKPLKIKKFNIHGKYKYDKEYPDRKNIIGQKYSLYSAETKKAKVRLDKIEHSDYKWVKFESALKKLSWRNQRKCLKIVDDWLTKKLI